MGYDFEMGWADASTTALSLILIGLAIADGNFSAAMGWTVVVITVLRIGLRKAPAEETIDELD